MPKEHEAIVNSNRTPVVPESKCNSKILHCSLVSDIFVGIKTPRVRMEVKLGQKQTGRMGRGRGRTDQGGTRAMPEGGGLLGSVRTNSPAVLVLIFLSSA